MLDSTFKKISGSNHYTRSGLVVSGISFILIVLFIAVGAPPELVFDELILRIFATAALISHLFSNATYIAGTIDLFQEKEVTTKIQIERWLTLIGIIVGLSLGMYLAFTLLPISFFSFFSTTTVVTGAFSGLGSRIGGLGRREPIERYFLSGSGILGCGMGIFLTLTGTPIMHISGVITFVTCGSPLITSIIFVFLITSLCMSGADYFSKSLSYLCKTYRADKHHEYEGTFCGSLLSVAAILFFITHLHLLATATFAAEGTKLAVATTVALLAKCFGIDGICSRVGRTLDRFFNPDDTVWDKGYKVLLVVTGVAGFLVVVDMVVKLGSFFWCERKPAASPAASTSFKSTPRLVMDQTAVGTEQIEQQNKFKQEKLPSSDQSPERAVSWFSCFSFFALWRNYEKTNDKKEVYSHTSSSPSLVNCKPASTA